MLKPMTLSSRRWVKIESLILVAVTTLLCYQVGFASMKRRVVVINQSDLPNET